ncbi:MAG: hypothetical protein ACOCQD_03630 [archaeon]
MKTKKYIVIGLLIILLYPAKDAIAQTNKQLENAVNEINSSCPLRVDKDTRFDNAVLLSDNVLKYNFTLVNHKKTDLNIERIKDKWVPNLINKVKTSPDLKLFRDHEVTMKYNYHDMNGRHVMKVTITPDMYKSTTNQSDLNHNPNTFHKKTKIQSGWKRIFIKNVGRFDLPPTMEIQKGKYKEFNVKMKRAMGFDESQLIAQQKGLNNPSKEGFDRYARIMLNTTEGEPGEFEKIDFNISEVSSKEISQLNKMFKQQMKREFTGTNLKLIKWYPIKLEKVNGMSCIHIKYKRQFKNKPYVMVNTYNFHNYDRMHMFTLSYRLSEADYWKNDFEKVLESFRITNIRENN